jgi:L-cystine transport system ATP-binding protein
VIRLSGLYKSFNANLVLENVNLAVEAGDVVAVLGPSGSGKTTLLRCVNFLDKADEGEITIGDLTVQCGKPNMKDVLGLRRKTAMVFQNYNLFRHKTVLENVMEGLIVAKKLSKPRAREKSMSMLDCVGMHAKLDAYPSQLSGGQQQRVGIARALALEPEIILFDEPTSALDTELVGEVLGVIKAIASDGITMMIVTHELSFAREVSNRVVFMDGGQIVEEGTSSQLFSNPRELRTKQFMKRFSHGAEPRVDPAQARHITVR